MPTARGGVPSYRHDAPRCLARGIECDDQRLARDQQTGPGCLSFSWSEPSHAHQEESSEQARVHCGQALCAKHHHARSRACIINKLPLNNRRVSGVFFETLSSCFFLFSFFIIVSFFFYFLRFFHLFLSPFIFLPFLFLLSSSFSFLRLFFLLFSNLNVVFYQLQVVFHILIIFIFFHYIFFIFFIIVKSLY